jgi:crotonobetainyl-CoA:carnitine CoA-transferase CaiB-like acyl-CoA transferase
VILKTADKPPVLLGIGAAAYEMSDLEALSAIGYALYYREKTGVGHHIDISTIYAPHQTDEV